MKKFNLTGILLASSILFSCQPKTEKKEPIIYQNNQNFKYDDEPSKEKTIDTINKKANLTKTKASKDNG
jgi:hypothetical protein